jgi:hypothetical protein
MQSERQILHMRQIIPRPKWMNKIDNDACFMGRERSNLLSVAARIQDRSLLV